MGGNPLSGREGFGEEDIGGVANDTGGARLFDVPLFGLLGLDTLVFCLVIVMSCMSSYRAIRSLSGSY